MLFGSQVTSTQSPGTQQAHNKPLLSEQHSFNTISKYTAAAAAAAKSLQSNSVRPHRWQPTRLPCPWDSPGKNTGVGCHFLLQCMKVKSESEVVQSCPTLCNPMDCSLLGSSIHGIFQARVLEWGAIDCLDPFYFCSLSATPGPFSKFFLRGFLLFLLVLK